MPISPKIDLKLLITRNLNHRPLFWARVEESLLTTTSTSKYKTRLVVQPNGYVGINLDNPRSQLDVLNTSGDKGLNQPVAIFGVLTDPTTPGDQNTRHIQIVPDLTRDAFNRSSEQGDLGIFYTDGLNPDGLNVNAGLVIAPWNASSTNVGFLGMRITNEGAVGIGTRLDQNPYNYKLAVNGTIGAKEVNVEEFSSTWWPDYVFDSGYNLISIIELEAFIKQNKHLPEIPSASEIAQTGVNLADMNARLLRKVEELSLYIIDLNNRLDKLEANEK